MTKRIGLKLLIVIIAVAIGFFYLIRSCLAKFDERSSVGGGSGSQAASQFLVFVREDSSGEKDGKGVIFSLVKYDRTTSYSQKGGMTRKSVSSTYYAQANDLVTAEKTGSEKIKKHSQIKAYPVELMGAAGDKAWLFAGELMAYDPFTLTKLADAVVLEEKNPVLKGKLINERKYYEFDHDSKQITITAADGAVYSLNTTTLIVAPIDDEKASDPSEKEFLDLDKKIKTIRTATALTYDRLRQNNQLYQQKTLSLKQYQDSSRTIQSEVSLLNKQRDSLEKLAQGLAIGIRSNETEKRRKETARRLGGGFNSMKLNNDTLNGQWYGLYNNEELAKLSDRFDHRTLYNDAARNKLYTAPVTPKDNYWTIGDERREMGTTVFLQGGFLINKETGLPFQLQQDFLVVYKDRIGNDGMVQLARINTTGKQLWTINTGLKEFYDWQLKGDKLIVVGTDNKDLSSGEVNLLQIVNLQNGSVAAYDFFKDKIRNQK
jgi:hypothetical protein